MADEKIEQRPARERVTVTASEYRADPGSALREAMAGKTVTVTDAQGEPRMYILGQTEPLDD